MPNDNDVDFYWALSEETGFKKHSFQKLNYFLCRYYLLLGCCCKHFSQIFWIITVINTLKKKSVLDYPKSLILCVSHTDLLEFMSHLFSLAFPLKLRARKK